MTLWESLLLGIIQGIFMFFPVSSTSHLALTQHWLIQRGSDLPPPESPEMIFFDLVVHVGTLVSIAVVFRHSLSAFLKKLWQEVLTFFSTNSWNFSKLQGLVFPTGKRSGDYLYLRLAVLGIISVLVTGLIGFPLRSLFKEVFERPSAIALTLTLTGILLWYTDRKIRQPLGLREMNPGVASVIGIGQGLALLPGLSRSGMTISFSLFAGLKRKWAAEYSFFIAFPTILGATLLQSLEVFQADNLTMGFVPLTVGFIVSAIIGIIALQVVLNLLYKARFRFFSYYVWTVAVLVIWGMFQGIF